MSKDEALRLALEVLQDLEDTQSYWWQEVDEVTLKQMEPAITAIKAALEAKDEPVCEKDPQGCWLVRCQLGNQCKNTPPQRKPLSNEEISSEINNSLRHGAAHSFKQGVRWAEKMHGIKEET